MTRKLIPLFLVSSAALAQDPKAATQVPASAIQHKSLQVPGANDEWTSSSVRCEPGDVLLLAVTGKVKFGEFTGELEASEGNFYAKVGTGAPTPVPLQPVKTLPASPAESTRFATLICAASGTLKFRVHDSKYSDNGGAFAVGLIRLPRAQIPSPEQVVAED